MFLKCYKYVEVDMIDLPNMLTVSDNVLNHI